MQGIVNFGSHNAVDLSAEQVEQYKLDAAALQTAGCELQLVLLPWGAANKAAKGHYHRYTEQSHAGSHTSLCPQSLHFS